MLRSKVATLLVAVLAAVGFTALGAPAGAAPAQEVSAKVVTKAPVAVSKRAGTISCEGQTFNHGGLVFSLGSRMGYTFGYGDAGKIRMVKVFTNNGSAANFGLGAISWSGAVVESWSYGVPNYCITFPGSSQGVVVTGMLYGNTCRTRNLC